MREGCTHGRDSIKASQEERAFSPTSVSQLNSEALSYHPYTFLQVKTHKWRPLAWGPGQGFHLDLQALCGLALASCYAHATPRPALPSNLCTCQHRVHLRSAPAWAVSGALVPQPRPSELMESVRSRHLPLQPLLELRGHSGDFFFLSTHTGDGPAKEIRQWKRKRKESWIFGPTAASSVWTDDPSPHHEVMAGKPPSLPCPGFPAP